jgi:tetratricopeptide (TPR) repeat protein
VRAPALVPLLLFALAAVPALPQQQSTPRVRPRDKYPKNGHAPVEPAQPEAKQKLTPQEPLGQIDSIEAIFDVMAAINAGGYNEGVDSASNDPLRQALREYIVKQDPRSVDALKRFVRDHKLRNSDTELNQYVSFALLTKGPPDFTFINPDLPLPPEVVPMDGFAPLLAAFYKEANLGDVWKRAQPSYQQAMAKYTEPVSEAILQVNAYLRNVTSGFLGRRFLIYVDLLGGPNQVQTRNYIDDYYVVITPSADVPVSDIRHAFLHFMVDPLILKYSENLKKKKELLELALDSPILEENYRLDFVQLADECFIKAIESHIERKPAQVEEAMREGYILTPVFSELLDIYEKQEEPMRLYFPELVDGIVLKKEQTRLAHIDFVKERPVRTILTTHGVGVQSVQQPLLGGAEKTLDEAEQAYTARDLERAKQTYLKVLQETAEKPMHAKAYYGLARVAVLEKDPETGDRLFRKVLELEPDAATKSWSLLYLGRLADSQGDRDEAQKHYHAVLEVQGAPDTVRQAAEKGIQEAFSRK